jgi:alkylhydroperoxidase family enzyme
MSRLPLLTSEDLDVDDRDVVATGMNLHRALAHSPAMARQSRQMGLFLRNGSKIDPRLRELAIIQVAYALRSSYEYSHHLKIALDAGVDPKDIAAIPAATRDEATALDETTSAVLTAARECALGTAVSQTTFERLRGILSPAQIVDLLFAISFYCGFVRLTGSLDLAVEPSYQVYLEQFPLGG